LNPTIDKLNTLWLEHNLRPAKENPVVLFDIDSTIMNTSPRNYRILQEAEETLPYLKGVSGLIRQEDIGWNLINAVNRILPLEKDQKAELHNFWKYRFFHDFWLAFDTPYKGIKDVLDWFLAQNIRIVYLTGRDRENMKFGTLNSFKKHGLPVGRETTFLFKPNQKTEDLPFKKEAFEKVGRMGTVLLAVENEPANANAMKKAFPGARIALIDTVTAPNPDQPDPEIILFRSY
jgi:beta-phosphoglucomutase-like phosphatase (HAD superfamily)